MSHLTPRFNIQPTSPFLVTHAMVVRDEFVS